MPTMLHLVHCYISTFGTFGTFGTSATFATFGASHHDGRGIWYRYPREEGGSHPYHQGYQPPNTHLAKPEFLPDFDSI